ncbi:MAG: hypothetical protein H6Q15_1101 [Bacteroidetes bacterium]|nr:hypothetical protein [Bacteroidota bacterium]
MKGYIKNLNGLNIKYIIVNSAVIAISSAGELLFGNANLNYKMNMYISFVMMLAIIFFIFRGRRQYQKHITNIKQLSFGQKLNAYQAACKKRVESFTAVSLVACLGLIISGNWLYLAFSAFSLVLIILSWSNATKIKFELGLTEQEYKSLEQKTINPIYKK